uniref:Calcium channel, voltage-dependent, alpha 2/delta subunit 1a n=1 Tax=Cyprinus carpio carpio TaxID=630221 RepID=A0A8C1BEG6_CYPCA
MDAETGIQKLQEIFLQFQRHYDVKQNNASQLVSKAAREIKNLLANRSKALEALATAAENLQKEHQWKDDLDVNETIYYNAKNKFDINDTESHQNRVKAEFKEDPVFKRPVSYNTTAVHIPTDIYEGSTIILNELNWTAALDEVFKKNWENDPSLLWQVFGSATGLARYFPASPWVDTRSTPNKIDLYDVRRRPWYIQGAASPKNMLILVDASGSVSGLTLKLIRTSVSEMLETLSDDDYVNIVSFNNSAKSVACFENLVQANVRNKKILKEAVQKITANGTTDYKIGFKEAFEQLSSMNVTRASCNKIIMLFTDGGEDRASEIFEEYNPDKEVRIFTFSVGQHNYDKTPIQWMACNNKGYYYEIPSIGAIRINTQEYLDVLGRPMVKEDKKAKTVQWTNVYVDALELGLVITGTLPVFNKTSTRNSQDKNKLILGVMAVDVSLDDIKRLTPHYTVRLVVVCLQDLKSQEPVTLDFLDAELEDEMKVEVRANLFFLVMFFLMLNTHTHTHTHTKMSVFEFIYFICLLLFILIYFLCLPSSLALVLPDYSISYIKATILDTITQAKCKYHNSHSRTFINETGMPVSWPQRDYCTDLKAQSDNITQFLIDFNEYIDTKTPNNPLCNMELINRLLLDAGITAELAKYWSEQRPNETIKAKFVATDGGVTRVYPASAGSEWTEQAETYKSSFYKRSLDNDVYIFTSAPNANNGKYVFVIIIHQYPILFFLDLMDIFCPLFIRNSRFSFSENLINESLFSVNITYDYQALCEPTTESKAAAGLRSVYVPTIADILNIGWWASAAACVVAHGNCVLFTADLDEDLSEIPSKESCIKEQKQYFFGNNETTFKGTVDCQNCSRQFIAEKLPKTNLVFHIISDCADLNPELSLTAPGPDPCKIAQNPRYRKDPKHCFDNNSSDEAMCRRNAGSPLLSSLLMLLLPVFMCCLGSVHLSISLSLSLSLSLYLFVYLFISIYLSCLPN